VSAATLFNLFLLTALVGLPDQNKPVILTSNGQQYGIWVSPPDTIGAGQNDVEHPPCASSNATIEGFSITGFTIKDFEMHGVHLACVHGFSITNNVADGNQVYGLFPIVSENGVLSNNEVKNTPFDAALYIGQSRKVLISGNKVHDSLIGIELENIRDCTIIQNHSFNNTAGIVIDSAPSLTRPSAMDNLISGNLVTQNNKQGIPDGPPSGIGILVTVADDTLIFDNQVSDNQLSGIFVTSRVCPGDPTCGDPHFIPTSNNNRIVANNVVGNGTVPNINPLLDALRADLSWDGTGSDNCWSFNQFVTSASPPPTTLSSCNASP
jgi:parallel beta-helix repeat protein